MVQHLYRRALTLAELEETSRALAAGESIRCVAARFKRAVSTVSREIQRNGGKTWLTCGECRQSGLGASTAAQPDT
ncbi:helix-turn-helix domain-containing protein [Comamonas testosteroni]|nr:helix-turn-helix domain-containing protein [Comamonas testosteroni]WKL15218.1 helix-turn-helix domain-containing protein [Comamonas testosteroni]